MSFTYDPLPQGNYIRLLKVFADTSHGELVCEFQVVSLEDCFQKYMAVSYAWEDPTPVSTIKFSNGQLFPLSRTLTELLKSIRKRQTELTVWIDAICINQKDNAEKASQVREMGKVYSSAEQVLLWIGAGTVDTENAFRYMDSKKTLSWPDGWDQETDFSGLRYVLSLLERPWFRRVWVIQEVTLNDNILLVCGSDSLDFDNFRHCNSAIWKFFEDWTDYEDDHPAMLGLWGSTRLIFIRDQFQDLGAVRYETLLEAAFHCEATDKRDMIFAFRGIGDRKRPVPKPDYTATVANVYTQTAVALLCHGTSLDLLALCGIAFQRAADIPTWVPDLRYNSYTEPFVPCDRAGWNTGGPFQASPTIVSTNRLRLRVNPFDSVEATCSQFQHYSVEGQQKAVREILALRQQLPSEVSEEHWLDLIADSLIFGLNIEDEPAGLEYRDYFTEWLQWLQSSTSQDDLKNILHNKYHRTLIPRVDGWKAFLTKNGYFCIGPPEASVGDMICTVPGCRLPLVIRSDQRASEVDTIPVYSLVSWCFVQGIMYGESVDLDNSMMDILLH